MRNAIFAISALPVLLLTLGCGGERTYPVKGTVTFEGKPLPWGGSIAFYPIKPLPGKQGGGIVKEDGSYYLTTTKDGDGSLPGEFRVVINQVTQKEGTNRKDGEGAFRTPPVLPPAQQIPAIYGDSQNSPLTAKVEAKAQNEINFDLKRK